MPPQFSLTLEQFKVKLWRAPFRLEHIRNHAFEGPYAENLAALVERDADPSQLCAQAALDYLIKEHYGQANAHRAVDLVRDDLRFMQQRAS